MFSHGDHLPGLAVELWFVGAIGLINLNRGLLGSLRLEKIHHGGSNRYHNSKKEEASRKGC